MTKLVIAEVTTPPRNSTRQVPPDVKQARIKRYLDQQRMNKGSSDCVIVRRLFNLSSGFNEERDSQKSSALLNNSNPNSERERDSDSCNKVENDAAKVLSV